MPDYWTATPPQIPTVEDETAAALTDWAPIETTIEEDEEEQLQNIDKEVSDLDLTLEQIIAESQDQIIKDKIEQMAQTMEASGKRGQGTVTQTSIEKDWNQWCALQTNEFKKTYAIVWGEPTRHIPAGAFLVTRTAFKQFIDYSKTRPRKTKADGRPETLGFASIKKRVICLYGLWKRQLVTYTELKNSCPYDDQTRGDLKTFYHTCHQRTMDKENDANRDTIYDIRTRLEQFESTQQTIVALLAEIKSELINKGSLSTQQSLPPSPVRELRMLSNDAVQFPTSMAVRANIFKSGAPDSVRREQEASQLTPSHHRERLINSQLTPTKRSPHVADYLAPCDESLISPMSPFLKLPNETAFGFANTDLRFYPKITVETTWEDVFGLVKQYSQLWNAWRPFFLTDYQSCGDMYQHMYEGLALKEPKLNMEGHYRVYYPPIAAVNKYFCGIKQWKTESQTATLQKFVSIVRAVEKRASASTLLQAVQELDALRAESTGWAKVKLSSETTHVEGDPPTKRRRLNEGVDAEILKRKVLAPGLVVLKIGKEQKSKNQQSPRGRKSVLTTDDTVFT